MKNLSICLIASINRSTHADRSGRSRCIADPSRAAVPPVWLGPGKGISNRDVLMTQAHPHAVTGVSWSRRNGVNDRVCACQPF
jgi:hypothetical protein